MRFVQLNRQYRVLLAVVLLACAGLTPEACADTVALDLLPSGGDIMGPAGASIGWGYTLTNYSSYWLLPILFYADSFQNATPQDLFDYQILAPNATRTVNFNEGAGTGLYMLTWDSTAPDGFVNSGTFTLGAQWYDGDPASGGTYVIDALDATANYSATVTPSTAVVPEPSFYGVLLIACGGLVYARVRSRRRES
jgi:hypothetical protein